MAVTAYMYSKAPTNAFKKVITSLNESVKVKCALFTSSFAFNAETELFTSLTNEVAAGGEYTAGGKTCTTCTLTESAKVTTFNCDDVEWAASTITARYAVFYDDDSKVNLVCIDFGEDKVSSSQTFQIVINASGLFSITVV